MQFGVSFLLGLVVIVSVGCVPGSGGPTTLVVYSGRSESLVGALLDRFAAESGVTIRPRYADTAELAATILEEGSNSPADVFFAQDAGALGALAQRAMLSRLPDEVLIRVEPTFRSAKGDWVGVSGRARVVVYNPQALREEELPDSILGFTDTKWGGRIGWAPTNGSFQAFVTALRVMNGESTARSWLEGIRANSPKSYANNTAIVQAVAAGEIHVGFVNHYYLHAIQKNQGLIAARNYYPRDGGAGAMMNVAGAGILSSTRNADAARRFVEFLLSPGAQEYFAIETFEYPLVAGVSPPPGVKPIREIRMPSLDLNTLAGLEESLRLLRSVGVL